MSYPQKIRDQAKTLRKRGFSLNEISARLNVPKATIHDWVSHSVKLDKKARSRIARITVKGQKRGNVKRLIIVPKPKNWDKALVSVVAHLLFDGGRSSARYTYYNSSIGMAREVAGKVKGIFGLKPHRRTVENGVIRTTFYSADFARYLDRKIPALLKYIPNARGEERREFLRAFFDDEGNAFYDKKHRHSRVRGYQRDRKMLVLIKKLLSEFNIESKIERNEIVISRKKDMDNFRKEINFSAHLFLNPNRKNSIWKRRISKRKLLDMIIKPESLVSS